MHGGPISIAYPAVFDVASCCFVRLGVPAAGVAAFEGLAHICDLGEVGAWEVGAVVGSGLVSWDL